MGRKPGGKQTGAHKRALQDQRAEQPAPAPAAPRTQPVHEGPAVNLPPKKRPRHGEAPPAAAEATHARGEKRPAEETVRREGSPRKQPRTAQDAINLGRVASSPGAGRKSPKKHKKPERPKANAKQRRLWNATAYENRRAKEAAAVAGTPEVEPTAEGSEQPSRAEQRAAIVGLETFIDMYQRAILAGAR